MELITSQVVFYLLMAIITIFSVMAVTSRRILRAATYLLFVLFATAGIYFLLDYHFLGAVQLAVYAGGIIVLYVFSILLTSDAGEKMVPVTLKKFLYGFVAAVSGLGLTAFLVIKHQFLYGQSQDGEIDMKIIGHALMGTEKYQYILPFEALSILLLACIIGGIMVARKR